MCKDQVPQDRYEHVEDVNDDPLDGRYEPGDTPDPEDYAPDYGDWQAQFDDDPSPYDGNYSEE